MNDLDAAIAELEATAQGIEVISTWMICYWFLFGILGLVLLWNLIIDGDIASLHKLAKRRTAKTP